VALIGTINIAMTATTQALQKGLDSARSSLAGFGKSVMSLKGLIAGSFAGAGIAALGHFAGLADDLSDNVERLGVMFGDSSDVIVAQAERMNAAFGTSEITFTAMATKMGGLFKALGVAEAPAAEMTNQLLVMGQAIANFKGISLEEAMGKIQAGMAGKGKGLKEFGITVSATMSVQERFNALMSGGAGILGSISQRAMDAGASWQEFKGRLEEIEISLGKNLPEMIEPLFKELNVAVVAAKSGFKALGSDTLSMGEDVLTGAKATAEGMGWVQKSIGLTVDAWKVGYGTFLEIRAYFTDFLGYLASGSSSALKGLDSVFDALGIVDKYKGKALPSPLTGEGGPTEFLDEWSKGLHEAASKDLHDLQAEWEKPWPSEGINKAFDEARRNIDEARKRVTQPAENIARAAADAAAAAKNKPVEAVGKSAGAALAAGGMGTASVLTKGRFEIGDEGHKKKLEKNGDKTNELLAGIKANLEAGSEPEMMDDF